MLREGNTHWCVTDYYVTPAEQKPPSLHSCDTFRHTDCTIHSQGESEGGSGDSGVRESKAEVKWGKERVSVNTILRRKRVQPVLWHVHRGFVVSAEHCVTGPVWPEMVGCVPANVLLCIWLCVCVCVPVTGVDESQFRQRNGEFMYVNDGFNAHHSSATCGLAHL